MKNGKSPGDDGLPVEVLKVGGATVGNKLLNVFNAAYKAEMIPLDWQKGVRSSALSLSPMRLRDCAEDVLDNC